jgi:glutamine synthetase
VFLFKRLVREAALKHGIDATFMAKPIEGEPGSAMHVHQSLTDINTGDNLFANADGSDSDMFRHYIGGLQQYIPTLMPIFAPNVNSYRRYLADEPGNAPTNVEWGFENRTVGLRVPEAVPAARRVENRLPGSDTNPYLALAGNLIAGYLGIIKQLEPRPAVNGRFEGSSDELPTNFEASMDAMLNCETIREALGANFVDGFIGTRITEYEGFKRVISSWEREFLLSTV